MTVDTGFAGLALHLPLYMIVSGLMRVMFLLWTRWCLQLFNIFSGQWVGGYSVYICVCWCISLYYCKIISI